MKKSRKNSSNKKSSKKQEGNELRRLRNNACAKKSRDKKRQTLEQLDLELHQYMEEYEKLKIRRDEIKLIVQKQREVAAANFNNKQ